MENRRTQPAPNALADEVAAAGHPDIADKLRALDTLYAGLAPEAGGHRPLTRDERTAQADNTLTVEELDTVQAVEYGTWVANQAIPVGNALAYGVGHPVPVSHVARFGYDVAGQVDRVTPLPAAPVGPADTTPTEG